MRALAAIFLSLILPVSSGLAADETSYSPSSAQDWSGAYVGVSAGYGWFADQWLDPELTDPFFGTVNDNGVLGGIHAGYNIQRGQTVFGIELDIDYSRFGGWQGADPASDPFFGFAQSGLQGSARARAGYAIDDLLLYATAGLSVAEFSFNYNFDPNDVGDGYNDTLFGFTLGAGVEKMVTQNASLRLDYRFTDYGSSEGTIFNCCAALPFVQRHDVTTHQVKLGLSLHF